MGSFSRLEKSMTGKLRPKPLSSGNFGGAEVFVSGGMQPGVEAKLVSSSIVDRRVVNCEVRFSADLIRRLM